MLEKCRICLRNNLTDGVDLENCLQMIIQIAQINIFLDENLPNQLCSECAERIVDAYVIREMCIKSEEHWENVYICQDPQEEINSTKTAQEAVVKTSPEVFETVVDESVEMDVGSQVAPLRCCLCNKYFTDESLLETHCLTFHGVSIIKSSEDLSEFECRICNHTCTEDEFWSHQPHQPKFPKVERVPTKRRATSTFTGKTELPDSVKKIVNEAVDSICCQCAGRYATLTSVKNHLKNVHSNFVPNVADSSSKEIVQCKVCLGTFASKEDYETHFRRIETKIFPCLRCDKMFDKMWYVKKHWEEEHSEYPMELQCNQCDRVYSKYSSIDTHMKEFHIADRRINICDICGKIFSKFHYLQAHRRVKHFGIKSYACKLCSKTFGMPSSLKAHMQSHTGEKPYKCPHCDKCYGFHTDWKTHIAAKHGGEWSFHCPTCNRGFMKPSQLKLHQQKSHHVEN